MGPRSPEAAPVVSRPGALYSRSLGGKVLLTNDWGSFAFVSPGSFARLAGGALTREDPEWEELRAKGFLREQLDFPALAARYRERHHFLWTGPTLHILVVTLRCNHACLYCHSSAVRRGGEQTDMARQTARAAVDMVFAGPSPNLTIEFQGGEPLLNWPVVRFVVRYARRKNRAAGRNLFLSLVSNLSLLDEQKLEFLLAHEVSLCTSLDGPADVHDRNRIFRGGSSQELVARWLRRIEQRRLSEAPPKRRIFKPSALMTTTRFSLPHARRIVDAYVELGLEGIFLRPLSPIGYAKRVWDRIGYGADDYLRFYAEALDHIIDLNLRGRPFAERMAATLAYKILRGRDPNYLDCRSPCGAAIGQLAYNYDGDVYTCDEGRMVAQQGDRLFRVGNVRRDTHAALMGSPAARACCAASLLESHPACASCAYKPFCGVCPVYNYEAQGSLWGQAPRNMHCRVQMGIFDLLFKKLSEPAARSVIESWLDRDRWEARP